MAVSANVLGDAGDVGGQGEFRRRQRLQHFVDRRGVLTDQRTLDLAFFRFAEHIEGRPAQALELGQQLETGQHPGAELAFLQLALVVFSGQQRRGEVVIQLVVALELRGHLVEKTAVGVQACNLVFVLVGHQLEQVAGNRFSQLLAVEWRFGSAHLFNVVLVALRIGSVLVAGQKLDALGDHVVQVHGLADELDDLRRLEQRLHGGQIVRRATAPFERELVVLDLHVVEFDRPDQRLAAQRDAALLPGVAEHQWVGVERVANELHGELIGIERADMGGAGRIRDRQVAVSRRELPVRVGDERSGGRSVGVHRDERAAFAHHRQRGLVGGNDRVAADHQISLGGADLGGQDRLAPVRDLDVAPGRAAFLCQAC